MKAVGYLDPSDAAGGSGFLVIVLLSSLSILPIPALAKILLKKLRWLSCLYRSLTANFPC
jgi:hypothetical protein